MHLIRRRCFTCAKRTTVARTSARVGESLILWRRKLPCDWVSLFEVAVSAFSYAATGSGLDRTLTGWQDGGDPLRWCLWSGRTVLYPKVCGTNEVKT